MNTEQLTWAEATQAETETSQTFPIPTGTIDFVRWEVCHLDGQRCALSKCETQLLAYLVNRAGQPVSRDELLERVWGLDPARTTTRTIDMHVAHLRKKLRDTPQNPMLVTIRSKGYCFSGRVAGRFTKG